MRYERARGKLLKVDFREREKKNRRKTTTTSEIKRNELERTHKQSDGGFGGIRGDRKQQKIASRRKIRKNFLVESIGRPTGNTSSAQTAEAVRLVHKYIR